MKPRILLSSWISPIPTTSGGAQRSYLLYKALAEIADVDFVLLSPPSKYTEQEMATIREEFNLKACMNIILPQERIPWKYLPIPHRFRWPILYNIDGSRALLSPQPNLRKFVEKTVDFASYDLVVGRYARSLAVLGLHQNPITRLALDVDDWDLDVFQSRRRVAKPKWKKRMLDWHIHNLRKALPPLIKPLSTIWVSNKSNLKEPLLDRALYLPNIPFLDCSHESSSLPFPPSEEILTTIGTYAHIPNVTAVDWFLGNVWPRVIKEHPQARFKICGSNMKPGMRERWSRHPNVDVVGFVERIEDAYSNAVASICAVSEGAGTNVKVLESLMLGRACVCTVKGANGYDDLVETGAIIPCNDALTMTTEILKLFRNRSRAAQLGLRASDRIKTELTFSTFSKIVAEGVEAALKAPAPNA